MKLFETLTDYKSCNDFYASNPRICREKTKKKFIFVKRNTLPLKQTNKQKKLSLSTLHYLMESDRLPATKIDASEG